MTKGELRAFVQSLINRDDLTDALTDQYVDLAHKRVQRTLRLPCMEQSMIYENDTNAVSALHLPNDFIELIDLINPDSISMSRLGLGDLLKKSTTEKPLWFAREREFLHIRGYLDVDAQIKLIYYGELTAFVDDNSTTTLSNIAYDMIAYQAASFICTYFVDERKALFEEMALTLGEELNQQAMDQEFTGGIAVNVGQYSGMF